MHILLFNELCVCVCVCVHASTLSWKEEELLLWVPCYSRSHQATLWKKPIAPGKCSLYNSRKDKETMRTSAKYYACTGTEQKGLVLIPKHSSLTKDINSQHLPTSPKQLRSWATLS